MKLIVKRIKKGMHGLFADEPINKGNIILILKGTSLPISTKTSIRIRSKNIEHYEGGYMNHHCNPSAKIIVIDDCLEGIVVAERDILEGEEVTFDYNTTEPILSHPFQCDCHGRWIKGFTHL
jgi:hypothetical protein